MLAASRRDFFNSIDPLWNTDSIARERGKGHKLEFDGDGVRHNRLRRLMTPTTLTVGVLWCKRFS